MGMCSWTGSGASGCAAATKQRETAQGFVWSHVTAKAREQSGKARAALTAITFSRDNSAGQWLGTVRF